MCMAVDIEVHAHRIRMEDTIRSIDDIGYSRT